MFNTNQEETKVPRDLKLEETLCDAHVEEETMEIDSQAHSIPVFDAILLSKMTKVQQEDLI